MHQIIRLIAFLVVLTLFIFPPGRSAHAQERTIKSKYEFSTPELNAAQKLYSGKKYAEALSAFETIIEKAKASQNYEEQIFAMEKRALALRRLNRYDDAIATMDEAIQLALEKLPKGHFLVSKMYYTRGTTDHTLRNYYSGRAYLDTALVYYNNSTKYDSSAYYRMVEYKYFAYRYSEGSSDTLINYLDELKRLEEIRQRRSPNPDIILNILQEYPAVYRQKGDFEQALAYAIRGVKYAKENRPLVSNRYYAEAHYYLAQVLFYKKDYAKALSVGLSAMPIVESTPRSKMPEYYAFNNLIGTTYMALGDFEQALIYLDKAMEVPLNVGSASNRRSNIQFHARMMINLGICYENLGQIDRAESFLKSSLLEMRKIIPYLSPNLHGNYEQLGDFYSRHGKWNESLNAYDSALRNGLVNYRGSVLDFPNDDDTGITYSYTDLRTLTKKSESLREVALLENDDREFLIASVEFSKRTNELLMRSRQDLIDAEGRLFLSENFKILYETGIGASIQLFNLTGQKEFFDSALYFSKQSKAILFLEQSQEIDIVNTNLVPIEVKEKFFETKRDLENLQNHFYELIDNSLTNDSVLIINEELLKLKINSREIKDSITQIVSENIDDESVFNMLFDGSSMQPMPKKNALIEFFYGEENIYVFGRSAKSYSFRKIESKQKVENSLQHIINVISTPPVIEEITDQLTLFKEHSYYLFSQLIEPVLNDLGSDITHLVIVPDEFLSRLPFEILIQSSSSGSNSFNSLDYLIRSFNVRYELSSELIGENLPNRKAEKGLLGVGFIESEESENRSDYGSLPGTEREIKFLQSSIEGTYLIGDSGTKSQFLNKAKEYDLLHLAIHGKADDVNRYESSLIFNGGEDNTLSTNDLYLASLNARIAVLSACESGIGTEKKGEGTFSIARGFALVGVPSIVMSLWKVNDQVTSNLMMEMYKGFINENKSVNEALRSSKLSYLESSDDYSAHPFYWAAFLHLGANVELNEEKTFNEMSVILGVSLLAFLILIIVIKRKRAI